MANSDYRYTLTRDEDNEELAKLLRVDGLGGEIPASRDSARAHRLEISGCVLRGELGRICGEAGLMRKISLGNANIIVLSREQEPIGSYYFALAEVVECSPVAGEKDVFRMALEGLLMPPARPGATAIWERWRIRPPDLKGEWVSLTRNERAAWLEVAAKHQERALRRQVDVPGGAFEIEGRHITDLAGFYCALGEAVRGPGGYFGADLDGLADCLAGGFGVVPPFTLRWRDANVARDHLVPEPGMGPSPVLDSIVALLREKGVQVELQ